MHRLIAFLGKLSFKSKLTVSMMIISLVIIIYTGCTYFYLATNKVKEMSMRLSEYNAQSGENALSSYLDDIISFTSQVFADPSLQTFSSMHNPGLSDIEIYPSKISSSLDSWCYKAANTGVALKSVSIFLKNGYSFTTSKDAFTFKDYSGCLDYFQGKDFQMTSDYTRTFWSLVNITGKSQPVPVCVSFIYSNGSLEKLGVGVFVFNNNDLYKSYSSYTEKGIIVSNQGIVLVSPDQAQIGLEYDNKALVQSLKKLPGPGSMIYHNSSNQEVILSYYPVMDQSGYLVVPFDFYSGTMQKEMAGYLVSTLLFAALGLACSFFLSLGLSQSLTRSISSLIAFIKRVGSNQSSLRYKSKSNDEISMIGDKVNEMLDNLKLAADTRERDLIVQQQLELSLMQFQINPHLLYNTLDSVLWSLENDRPKDAAVSIASLSEFFKISLSRGNMIIPLCDEIHLIQHYIDIQRLVRHKDITLITEIDPQLEQYPIVKLSLQPIIENAILHGFAGYREDGRITITAHHTDSKLFITVNDNGIGILPDELERMAAVLQTYPPKQDINYFGLYNVNRRLVQTYGSEYGIQISSRVCEYTEVTVTIPYVGAIQERRDLNV